MQPTKKKALVLLGVRNSGKDTLANLLIERMPGRVMNCKFSSLTKSLVASAFGVPLSDLEDKRLRTTPVNPQYMGELTTLDLLDALFHALQLNDPSCKRLRDANIRYLVERAYANSADLCVFTDVRREVEADAVKQYFDVEAAVVLDKHDTKAYSTDKNLNACKMKFPELQHLRIGREDTPADTLEKLMQLLYNTEKEPKA